MERVEGNEKLFLATLPANFWRFGYAELAFSFAESSISSCVEMTENFTNL
jgi:hypothetical protein